MSRIVCSECLAPESCWGANCSDPMPRKIIIQMLVNRHADQLLRFWQHAQAEDPWTNRELRQAYYDALNSMKHAKLIKDFSLRGIVYQDLEALAGNME